MNAETAIWLYTLIMSLMIVKHFICDFVLQYPRHYLNKGTYGKWGGIEHALIHGVATAIILNPLLGLIDALIHYHIDWAKMSINKKMGWKPDNSEHFWTFLGLDQLLHYLTYVGLIYSFLMY